MKRLFIRLKYAKHQNRISMCRLDIISCRINRVSFLFIQNSLIKRQMCRYYHDSRINRKKQRYKLAHVKTFFSGFQKPLNRDKSLSVFCFVDKTA